MAKCNITQDALDYAKECEAEWFQDCVWVTCPETSTTVRNVANLFQVLDNGSIVEQEDGARDVCRWFDFLVGVSDYYVEGSARKPAIGDLIYILLNGTICVCEVRGRSGDDELAEWDYMDHRKCQMIVRTIICDEITTTEFTTRTGIPA